MEYFRFKHSFCVIWVKYVLFQYCSFGWFNLGLELLEDEVPGSLFMCILPELQFIRIRKIAISTRTFSNKLRGKYCYIFVRNENSANYWTDFLLNHHQLNLMKLNENIMVIVSCDVQQTGYSVAHRDNYQFRNNWSNIS